MHFAGYLKLAQRLSQNEQGAFQKEDHHTKFVWFNVKKLKDILIHQRRASRGFSPWLPSQHRRELWEPDSQDGGRGGTKQFRRSLAMKEENKQTMCYLVTTRAVWRGFWGQAVWRLVNRVGVGRSLYVGFKGILRFEEKKAETELSRNHWMSQLWLRDNEFLLSRFLFFSCHRSSKLSLE